MYVYVCVCIYVRVRDLQSFGRCRWSLEFQGEHAGAEGQVVELQSFTENSKKEGGFWQRVSGYLRLTAGWHLALLTLKANNQENNNDVRTWNKTVKQIRTSNFLFIFLFFVNS